MAFYKQDIVDINLNTGNIHRSFLNHAIGYKNDDADRFGIRTFRDGVPQDLTGASCQAVFMAPNGSKIALTSYGTVSGNVAYVTLPPACYDYEGQFCLAIQLVGGGVTGTMRIVDGMVVNTGASGTVAPTSAVPTYQEIIAQYDAMVAATAAANGAIAATYSGSATYKVGDYCIHDGGLYRCTTAITTAEAWNAAHWTATKIGPDVSDLKSALSVYNIFDENNITTNRVVKSNGTIDAFQGCYVSGFIPLENAKYIAVVDNVGSNSYGHAFYYSNKQYIPNSFVAGKGDNSATGTLVMEVPNDAEYFVITGTTARISNQQIFVSFDYNDLIDIIEKGKMIIDTVGFTMVNETIGIPSANLFTNADVRLGTSIYYNFDVNEGKVCILAFYDSNNTRILYKGKLASSSGALHYEGNVMIPDGFSYAKFDGDAQNITVNIIATDKNNIIMSENIDSIDENITNDIIGTVIPNCFVTADGQDRVGYYTIQGCKCATCDVSRLIGKEIFISTTQLNTTYRMIYVFADKDSYLIDNYIGSNSYAETLDSVKVVVPANSVTLFVNCVSSGEIKIKTKNINELNDFPGIRLKGKKIVTYGDSLTWYDTHAFTWGEDQGDTCIGYQAYLRNLLKMSTVNRGVSGYTTPEFCASIRSANDLSDFDYMTIMGGDNDHRLSVSVGSIQPVGGTFNTSTVYGALQSAIEYALSENPNLRIILMTEPIGWTYRNGSFERVSDLIPNAYRRVAELYGIPLIDNWNNAGINELTRSTYYCDPTTDNELYFYHPNNAGWERISKFICGEMKDK